MAKHHVNGNTGNVGICKAKKGGCPFGSEEEHYNTAEEATAAAEKMMTEQYSTINTAYRKKDYSALDGMNRELKKRIISESAAGENKLHPSVVAKVFSRDNDELIRKNVSETFKSQKILKEMANDESARVRLAVAKSTNNPEVLKAFANDPDIKVRKAAIENKKTPVKVRKLAIEALKTSKTANLTPREFKGDRPAQKGSERIGNNDLASRVMKADAALAQFEAGQRARREGGTSKDALRAIYSGDLTPSSEARLKYLDEQLVSNDVVARTLAQQYKIELLRSAKGDRGKYAIDDVLERFDDDVNKSKIFPNIDYKGISRGRN